MRYLCQIAGVSRSGYYFSAISQSQREKRTHQDEMVKEMIVRAFRFKNRKKGARQIKMTLAGQFQVVYNLKRIRRIMKNMGLSVPFAKKILIKNVESDERTLRGTQSIKTRI